MADQRIPSVLVAAATILCGPPKKVFTLSSRYDHFAVCWRVAPDFPRLTRLASPPRAVKYRFSFLLLTLGAIAFATAKWSRVPGVDKRPVNMSLVTAGTTVSGSKGITQSTGFIMGDPLRPITLGAGKSEAVIKLVKQSFVEKASFVSDGLDGRVSASMSTDGKAWKNPASTVFTPTDRLVNLDLGAAQGRYLRLEFELARSGTIRSFQILGSHTERNYKVTQNEKGSGPMVNFASGIGGGRLIYINPESYAARSAASGTGPLSFPESDEKYRTAVYDFGQVRSLTEFGSVHSPRPVRLLVYAFDTLPEKEDWRGRLAFDPSVFDNAEPVASAEDSQGSGTLKIKARSTVKARYVAMRWEPDFNPPAFEVTDTSISGSGPTSFSSGDTNVDTDTNDEGDVVSDVDQGEESMEITVDGDTGEVTTEGDVSGGDSGGNEGGGGGENSESGDGGESPVININNPQNSVNGAGSSGVGGSEPETTPPSDKS